MPTVMYTKVIVETPEEIALRKKIEEYETNPATRLIVSSVPSTLHAANIVKDYKALKKEWREMELTEKWTEVTVFGFVAKATEAYGVCAPKEDKESLRLVPVTELFISKGD